MDGLINKYYIISLNQQDPHDSGQEVTRTRTEVTRTRTEFTMFSKFGFSITEIFYHLLSFVFSKLHRNRKQV